MGRYKRTYGSGNQLISDSITNIPQEPLIVTVATFGDLPASPVNFQQVIVFDNGVKGDPATVVWIDAISKWILSITNCEFASLPVGGIWSASPPVESQDFTTFAFDPNNSNGATYNDGVGWRQLADITPVATFGNLPVGVLYQQSLVLDNGFGEIAWVTYDGFSWIVLTGRVPLTANLPVDGVWNLSPVVNSATSTIISSNESSTWWNWDGITWDEYVLSLPVAVSEYTDLPLNAPIDYKLLCENTNLLGLGPLQAPVLQHGTINEWVVLIGGIADVYELPASTVIYSDATYTVSVTSGTILYSTDNRAWFYTGLAWQEFTPGSTFTDFTSLPALPPDNFSAYISQDEGSMFHPILLQYNAISNEWEIISAFWDDPSTLPDLSTPFYDVGGITVVGKVGTALTSIGRLFTWGGVSWTEISPSDSRNWGPTTNEATVNYTIGTTFHLDGDTFIDQSLTGTITKIWGSAQWNYYKIDWDGVSIGQTYADLPIADIYTGATALIGTDVYYWSGLAWDGNISTPTVTVTTFSLLPSDATVGQRVAITAEAGLADVSVVNTALDTWELERVSCLWSALPTSGTWYSSGGITVTTETDTTVSITGINDLVSGAAVWTGAKWRWAVNAEYFVISGVQSSTVEITAVSIPTGQLDPISNP